MDKLLIGLTTLRPGQIPSSRDVTLAVTPGQGRIRLHPDEPPSLGTVTQGRLILESESFPRFAPLSLTITGADLVFRVRAGKLIHFSLHDREESLLRLYCTGIFRAAYLYRLFQPLQDRVVVTRVNTLAEDCDAAALTGFASPDIACRTKLDVHLVEGELITSMDFSKGANHLVEYGSVELRRSAGGNLKVDFHGARMEWDIGRGNVIGLRVYDSRGAVATLNLLDRSGAGVTASVAVIDTLP